jgi:hypothetical protein
MQRGVLPSDSRLANERSNCPKQFKRQEPQPTGTQRSLYAVGGVTIGAIVRSESSAYRSTSAFLAINSTDSRGAKKPARARNGGE